MIDGVTGWHFKPATPAALSIAIGRALKDTRRLERMGEQARSHTMKYFTVAKQAGNFARIVNQALELR